MNGIVINYEYSGDEKMWDEVVGAFITALDADKEVGDDFSYIVTKSREGAKRTHIGRWKSQEILTLVQSREYFKIFASRLKELAGDSLSPDPMVVAVQTKSA